MNNVMRMGQWIVVGLCILMAACANTASDWQGTKTQTLFKRLGYPNRVVRLREGRYLLIYQKRGSSCKAMFKINPDRIIILERYKGGAACRDHFL